MAADMAQLGLVFFTEDQDRFTIPMKPDRPRLRPSVRIDGRKPDDLLSTKATIHVPAESAIEVYHGAS
jgi:hypothetical protein